MTTRLHWHRLFGITLVDYFTDTNYQVELEKDLSVQQQLLDVVIIQKRSGHRLPPELPDGLENLAKYNLLTYKSYHEPLDSWALQELLGHYVNYRKQISKSLKRNNLLPETDLRLYAVCAQYSSTLPKQVTLTNLQAGVYEAIRCLNTTIRIIVTSEVPPTANNTLWQLFSGVAEHFRLAQHHHHWRNPATSTVINQMYQHYTLEGVFMPYTMEDYHRDAKRFLVEQVKANLDMVLAELPTEEIVKRLSPDDMIKQLSPETRLQGLSPKEIVKRLSPETRLQGLSLEEIEAYLAKAKSKKPRRRQS